MALNPRDTIDTNRAKKVVKQLLEEWKNDPNILHITTGLKIVRGNVLPNELVISFFVREKFSPEELQQRGYRTIPAEVEGIPTDVEQSKAYPLASLPKRRERLDPLVGGIAVGNGNIQFWHGTLGGIVFDKDTDVAKGITNEHVLVNTNSGRTGDPVIQPAPPRVLEDYINLDFVPHCCPVGPLFFVQVPGPVTSFLTQLAFMSMIVALADDRDPTLRGQDATVPGPDERTLREHVDVELEYQDFPIPGTPFKIDVNWNYKRVTSGANYSHNVIETNTNKHVLNLQRLITNQRTYQRNEIVHLLASLKSSSQNTCAFHTIVYLVPGAEGQQGRSHMVMLQPVSDTDLQRLGNLFPELNPIEKCDYLNDVKPGTVLPPIYTHQGVVYENNNLDQPMTTVDMIPAAAPDGISEISFSNKGIRARLPFPVDFVKITVAQFSDGPVSIHAKDANGILIGSATAPNIPETEHQLEVRGTGIVEVVILGGKDRGVLIKLCYGKAFTDEYCYFYGRVALDQFDPLGPWRTYLFAQTINDVPQGTSPEIAAQTIGGLPVTRNFEYVGQGDQHYGKGCIFRPFIDGDFEVI